VRHLENPLFSARQNAPDGVNMMANTSLLGVTLPMAPVTLLFGPQVAYALYLGGALAATAGTSYCDLSGSWCARGRRRSSVAPSSVSRRDRRHASGQPTSSPTSCCR
jgi:hypothetical protein